MKKIKWASALLALMMLLNLLLTGCSRKEYVLIYTSVEGYVIEDMNDRLREAFPDYDIVIEYVSTGNHAAKLLVEGANSECDITYDLEYAYMEQLAQAGALADLSSYDTGIYMDDTVVSPHYLVQCRVGGAIILNTEVLQEKGLPEPTSYEDLLKPEYKNLVWVSNPNTAGTAKLIINTMVQLKGHDEAMKYFVELDKNIQQYTKSGSGPSKKVGIGECVIGVGFLHDGITQIVDNGYGNIELVIPSSGTSYEIGATAIFEGCAHPNAAKLWIEFALSPECVNLAQDNGSYQFLVIDNATQPAVAAQFGLDPENVMDYDFEDAKNNIKTYVEEVMTALGGGDDRFKTE